MLYTVCEQKFNMKGDMSKFKHESLSVRTVNTQDLSARGFQIVVQKVYFVQIFSIYYLHATASKTLKNILQ